jgi:CBS domain-containing protein
MKVREILKSKSGKLVTVVPEANIIRAMQLLIENRIGCLPVIGDNDQLVGIVSDKDVFTAVYNHQEGFARLSVSDIMSTNLIVGIPEDEIEYIAGIMTKNRIRHIPIMERDQLAGLVSIGDVVKHQMSSMEIENRYLKTYIEGNYPG